jgi:hypothetical protein
MRSRVKSLLKWSAWGLLVLIVLAAVVWTIANVSAESRFRAALESLRAAGYATAALEMAPAPVPPAENGAPFYVAAFALMARPGERDRDAMEAGPSEWNAERKASLRGLLASNADAFEMLEKARTRPRCGFERNYAQGFEMQLPEVSNVLELARLLKLRAAIQADAGDAAGARRSAEDAFALAHALSGDRILVSQLVRLEAIQLALAAVDVGVTAETSEAELGAVLAIVPNPASLAALMEPALRGELAMVADLLRGPPGRLWSVLESIPPREPGVLAHLARPLLKSDGARYLDFMRRMVELSAKPYLEGRAELASLDAEATARSLWHPVTCLLMPALARANERLAEVQARLAVTRAGLEAERTRKTTGRHPAQLQGTDPFSGKPLSIDGRRVWSAGSTPERKIEWRLRGN